MADLYLHIGAPKTGTSAIQAMLARNRETLAAQGVLYPRAGTIKSAHHLLGAALFPGRQRRLEGADRRKVLDEATAAIRAEIAEANPMRVILSSEYLWGELAPEQVHRLLAPLAEHRLHLVAYLRRQDLLAQSIYTQAVKSGAVRSFHDWIAAEAQGGRAGLHFDRVLAPWQSCGVPIELHLRIYERGQIDDDVTRDFRSIVCPQATLDGDGGSGTNSSPDRIAVELMRRISHRLDAIPAAAVRRRVNGATLPRETFAPNDFLDGPAAAALMETFAEGNARIARELLGRADGVLFREPLDLGGESRPVNGATMLDRLIDLLPEMLAKAPPAPAEPADEALQALLQSASGQSKAEREGTRALRQARRERRAKRGRSDRTKEA